MTFTSASTVDNFFGKLSEEQRGNCMHGWRRSARRPARRSEGTARSRTSWRRKPPSSRSTTRSSPLLHSPRLRSTPLTERISTAFLWIAAFCLATGVFLSLTLLFKALPPTDAGRHRRGHDRALLEAARLPRRGAVLSPRPAADDLAAAVLGAPREDAHGRERSSSPFPISCRRSST